MSTDEKTEVVEETPDAEAVVAAAEGAAHQVLEAAGVTAEAREGKDLKQLLAMTQEVVDKQKGREAKGKAESQDLKQMVVGLKDELKGFIETHDRKGEEIARDEEVERKIQFSAEVSTEPGDDGDGGNGGYEHKSMLERISVGTVSWRPDVKCLLNDPVDHASDLLGIPAPHVQAVRQINDRLLFTGILMHQAGPPGFRRMATPQDCIKGLASYRLFMEEAERNAALRKAMDTAESGAGLDWVPTDFSAELMDRVELQLKVASLFKSVPMPTKAYELPMRGDRATAYLAAESTSDTASSLTATDATTASPQLSAVKLAARVLFSDELSEDSIIPILPYVEEECVHALAYGEENAVVNGDTAGTHFDTGYTVAAGDVRRAWIGIRKAQNGQTPTAAEVDCGTFTTANLISVKSEMGVYGANPREGGWITSVLGFCKMLALTECLTLDKYGPRAVIHEGELAQFLGSPVVVSEAVGANLNAAGIYDGCTTTKTGIWYVHRPSFIRGQRSSNVESDRIVETQQTQVVAVTRKALVAREAVATNLMVGMAYNIA